MSRVSTNRIAPALERGLDFLARRQHADGNFPILVSSDPEMKKDLEQDSAHFATCLILYCLGFIRDERIDSMINAGCRSLASGMEGAGYWRFWPRHHHFYRYIPHDTDDTAFASFLLKKYRSDFEGGNRSVLLLNRDPRGLFYTWIFPRFRTLFHPATWTLPWRDWLGRILYIPAWRQTEAAPDDVDAAVNANALLYLREGGHVQPVAAWLENVIRCRTEPIPDKWYADPAVYYMISRARFEGVTELQSLEQVLGARISEEHEKNIETQPPLTQALIACSLMNISARGHPLLPKIMDALLDAQDPEGAWPTSPIFWGGPKRLRCWGSQEVSTALALEALARYEN
jgi:hypothetical protein